SRVASELALACYRAAREALLTAGYDQLSMRMFRRQDAPSRSARTDRCEQDGTVGLGCAARSYAPSLHYSTEYAVGRSGILAILQDYVARAHAAFATADYGVVVGGHEQRRRFLLLSLMQCAGVDRNAYGHRFGNDAVDDFPEVMALLRRGLATLSAEAITLT